MTTDTQILDWLEQQLLNKDGSWRVMGRHLLIENGERKRVHIHRGDGEREMRRLGTGTTLRGAVLNAMQTAPARSLVSDDDVRPQERRDNPSIVAQERIQAQADEA